MEDMLKLMGVLLTTTCGLDPRQLYTDNYAPNLLNGDSFDFIVVGSGPSGATIASRLAENPKWNVLLVEAGDYPIAASEIPGFGTGLMGTEFDWKYKTEPLENAGLGMNERRLFIARGKMLGGSSSINGMVYTRGLESDYDNWEKLGNPGWGWKDVEPYFKKLEKLENSNNEQYGKSGRLSLYLDNLPTEFQNIIMEAGRSLGKRVVNYEESKPGFFLMPTTISAGRRVSSAKAYLKESKNNKPNLHISLNTLVTKVIIKNQTATGIELLKNETTIQIRATREIILAAGTIGSPQILMLSGVGPESHLKKLYISVKKDLQVGENLQDHAFNIGIYTKLNALPAPETCVDAMNYCLHKNGSLAKNDYNLIWSLNTTLNEVEPSAHMHFNHVRKGGGTAVTLFLNLFHVNNSIIKSVEAVLDLHDAFSISVLLTNPKSRGRILLKSTNPLDHPLIQPGFYTDKNNEDLTAMVNAIDPIKKLLEAPAIKSLQPEIIYLDLPGCKDFDVNSSDYWNCHFRYMSSSAFHPVGTCKMGSTEDKAAVVDSTLKVYGIRGLRVADASIMPLITNRNTQAPTYMIGEKAADFIKQDHGFSN